MSKEPLSNRSNKRLNTEKIIEFTDHFSINAFYYVNKVMASIEQNHSEDNSSHVAQDVIDNYKRGVTNNWFKGAILGNKESVFWLLDYYYNYHDCKNDEIVTLLVGVMRKIVSGMSKHSGVYYDLLQKYLPIIIPEAMEDNIKAFVSLIEDAKEVLYIGNDNLVVKQTEKANATIKLESNILIGNYFPAATLNAYGGIDVICDTSNKSFNSDNDNKNSKDLDLSNNNNDLEKLKKGGDSKKVSVSVEMIPDSAAKYVIVIRESNTEENKFDENIAKNYEENKISEEVKLVGENGNHNEKGDSSSSSCCHSCEIY